MSGVSRPSELESLRDEVNKHNTDIEVLASNVRALQKQTSEIQSSLTEGFKNLYDKLNSSSKWDWGAIWTAVSLLIGVIGGLSAITISPIHTSINSINKDVVRLESKDDKTDLRLEKIEDKYHTLGERIQNLESKEKSK